MKVLFSITTTHGCNWRKMIDDVDKFGLTEIAVFLTGLDENQRKEFYKRLEKSQVKFIPHVHIKNDMKEDEFRFFLDNYDTRAFNIHSEREFPLEYDYSKYAEMIYLENSSVVPDQEELNNWAGLCVDFSHWEGHKKIRRDYDDFQDLLENNEVGCCHVSAIRKGWKWLIKGKKDNHFLIRLKDLDYLAKYKKYLPEYVSLELRNSIRRQIKAKKYLEEKVLKIEKK